eukprot:SAG11_NODE_1247_length_5401_cov_2.372878_11_plen_75_part_00
MLLEIELKWEGHLLATRFCILLRTQAVRVALQPVVSLGNVGQLAIDVLLASMQPTPLRAGVVESSLVLVTSVYL